VRSPLVIVLLAVEMLSSANKSIRREMDPVLLAVENVEFAAVGRILDDEVSELGLAILVDVLEFDRRSLLQGMLARAFFRRILLLVPVLLVVRLYPAALYRARGCGM